MRIPACSIAARLKGNAARFQSCQVFAVGAGTGQLDSGSLKLFSVPAWIPDTLRSFLAHEVENDELHLSLSSIADVGDLRERSMTLVILDLVSER